MNLVERDTVQLQPPRTRALALLDHRGERRDRHDLARYGNLGALVAECLAEDPLAFAKSVDLCGIEQGDSQGEGALHNITRGAGRVPVPVAPLPRAELPGAQSDPADSSDSLYVQISHTTTVVRRRLGERLRTTSHGRWMPTSSFSLRQQGTATHASSPDHGSRSLRGLPVCRARDRQPSPSCPTVGRETRR